MSMRLQMLQVARLAPKILGESTELVRQFVFRQQNEDGGFRDRAGKSDLYYTAFGLDCLTALQSELPDQKLLGYLRSFGSGEGLDFVHLCCLARSWAAVARNSNCEFLETGERIAIHLQSFRARDGGFNPTPGSQQGTTYGSFLGLGAYQDLGMSLSSLPSLVNSVQGLQAPDGGWANEPGIAVSGTNPTAAAVILLVQCGSEIPRGISEWILAQRMTESGFRATRKAPLPDLLSTATALHALAALQCNLEALKDDCLDFIDSLWTNEGSFHGHWGEDTLDVEYTFYGLLALGHLSY